MVDDDPKGVGRYRSKGTEVHSVFQGNYQSRAFDSGSGTWYPWSGYSLDQDHYLTSPSQFCADVVGNRGGDNPLYLSRESVKTATYDYTISVDRPETDIRPREQIEVVKHGFVPTFHCLGSGDEDKSDVEFITEAASALNPSRPDFDAAVFLGELRDLPGLLKFAGSNMAKYGANEYLKFQYGWRPFVKDLQNLMKAVDSVDRKLKQVRRLNEQGYIRKVWKPKDGSNAFKQLDYVPEPGSDYPDHIWPVVSSNSDGLFHQISTQMRTERWAILQWEADSADTPPPTDDQMLFKARQAVFGGKVDGSTLWQLMPWSWLLDWTSNASEYLMSQRDVVGCKLSKTVLMKTTQLESRVIPYLPDYPSFDYGHFGWSALEGSASSVIKERILDVMPSAEITGELSLLGKSPFKLSILGALGIQRVRGRL